MDLPAPGLPDPPESADPAVEEMVAALYAELRAVAGHLFSRERANHTLQPTAVVHEAFLKLSAQDKLHWEDRLHFLNLAAAQIRQILVDHARGHRRQKRGGDLLRVTFDESMAVPARDVLEFDLLDLDDALRRLEEKSPNDRRIVELKFFGGLTEPEIATVMGINERTVRRRWLFARTWLYRQLDAGSQAPG